MPREGASVVQIERVIFSVKMSKNGHAGASEGSRSRAGFLDGVCRGLVDWQYAGRIVRGHNRSRYALPCGEPRRAEIESATGPSEDCGKRHERTSKTDRTGWIVLGIRFARGCASTVAGSRTSAITSSASGPGARPAAAHTDRSAQHRER